jgi:hypothetical protein
MGGNAMPPERIAADACDHSFPHAEFRRSHRLHLSRFGTELSGAVSRTRRSARRSATYGMVELRTPATQASSSGVPVNRPVNTSHASTGKQRIVANEAARAVGLQPGQTSP